MAAPTPALAGFHSAEAKRAVTRTAWIGGVFVGLLQFALPMGLVGWALVHSLIGAFSTPRPEIEAPAATADFVWYTAPVPSDDIFFETTRTLLQVPRGEDATPRAVAVVEGGTRDPLLLAREDGLAVLSENDAAVYAQGQLTQRVFDDAMPRRSWPVAFEGDAAMVVLERDYEGDAERFVLSLRTFDDRGWQAAWTEAVSLAWEPDAFRAVMLGDSLHLFASDGDGTVWHAVRTSADLSAWSATPVAAMDWSAAALEGRPVLVALEDTERTTVVRGWRLDGQWQPLFREEAEHANSVGVTTLPSPQGERLGVLTDVLLDGVLLLEVNAEGEVVSSHEYSASTVMDEAIGMLVLSQMLPFALTLGFSLIISASMRRHRVTTFAFEGRTVRYASVAKRGLAKAIDSVLALIGPAAVLGPEILAGEVDDVRIAVVCMLWALPLGLAFTAWEGARGWTPGKRLLGIRVVGEDLRPPGFGPAFMRGLMGIADGFFSYMVGIVIVALNARWQRMGDQVAHTLVVEDDAGAAGERAPR